MQGKRQFATKAENPEKMRRNDRFFSEKNILLSPGFTYDHIKSMRSQALTLFVSGHQSTIHKHE